MTRRLNLIESSPDIRVPSRESVVRLLLLVIEHNDTFKSIDLCHNALVNHHVADLLLRSLKGDTDQCCQSLQPYARIVLLNYAQVVLDQLADQVPHMLSAVARHFLERLILAHLLLNFNLVHWHQFKRKHFPH